MGLLRSIASALFGLTGAALYWLANVIETLGDGFVAAARWFAPDPDVE